VVSIKSRRVEREVSLIQKERVQLLNRAGSAKGRYVAYWMQASQRAKWNHALEYAAARANELGKPLVVFFGITDRYPGANRRHYSFMLEGLRETKRSLAERGIGVVVRRVSPGEGIGEFARDACLVVADRGYTRVQREWRGRVAERMACPLVQVESDAIVPVETASEKEEYSAATIRRKLHRLLPDFLVPLREVRVRKESLHLRFDRTFDVEDPEAALARLDLETGVPMPVRTPPAGTKAAERALGTFVRDRLPRYASERNDPNAGATSGMSPYLHFGQISPLYIALRVLRAAGPGREEYLEELIVRRELAINFVFRNERYDRFECLPDWCRKTLLSHARDERETLYGLAELEEAKTHDPYWNAAQKEMVATGRMHGYMRMYWGKKILEWTKTPTRAFDVALLLNNRYELDGRDPNGFAGVAWCFGKHDRPWAERPVFGTIRYMNDRGLRRKFDADRYVREVDGMWYGATGIGRHRIDGSE